MVLDRLIGELSENPTPDELKNRVSEVLMARVRNRGLTVRQIACLMEMSVGSAANILAGNHDYKYVILRKMAAALRMDMVYLVYLIEEPRFTNDPDMLRVGQLLRERDERPMHA